MSQTRAALIHAFLCVLLSFLHHCVESQRRPHPCSRRRLRMCPSTERRLLAWYGKASRVERVKGLRARTERRVLGSVSPIETVPRKLKECARCWVISGSLFKYRDCRFTTPYGRGLQREAAFVTEELSFSPGGALTPRDRLRHLRRCAMRTQAAGRRRRLLR